VRLRLTVALAVALVATAGCGQKSGPGPIERANPHGWTEAYEPLHQHVGGVLTDGVETITIRGHRPAVLDDVRLVGASGLRIVGVKMTRKGQRGLMVGQILGFPPRWDTLSPRDRKAVNVDAVGPALGQTLQPNVDPSYELYIGMRITRPGPVHRRGIRIDYHIGGRHYSYYDPADVWICTKAGPCGPPRGWVSRVEREVLDQ
jgi:hypothetical protein